MGIYSGRDNYGRIVVDSEVGTNLQRNHLTPADAEKLGHELLALAYDVHANRAAYGDASDTEDHDRAVDDALGDDNHPENDASGEPDFGGNG